MRRRKKVRCTKPEEDDDLIRAPHSFVIRRGVLGNRIVTLTKNFRNVMSPYTARSLRERKRNKIKDFVAVAGLLHVTHLVMFLQTEQAMFMKVGRMPRGPSLIFKIKSFILSSDVVSAQKKPHVNPKLFTHFPLVVLNGFLDSNHSKHLKLMATMFQNMFPAIKLTNVDLNSIRRCVLFDYDQEKKVLEFRHYAIKVMPTGISKGVKKLVQGKVPNLATCEDISELLTKNGLLSDSEYEDDKNSHVQLPQRILSRGNIKNDESAIRLMELGPRLTLELVQIVDNFMDVSVQHTPKRSNSPSFLSPDGSFKSRRSTYYILEKEESLPSDETESILSFQGKVTDEARDTTDLSDSCSYFDYDSNSSDFLEYEIVSSSGEESSFMLSDSNDEEDIVRRISVPVMILHYSTESCITDSEASSDVTVRCSDQLKSPELKLRADYKKCLQCRMTNTNRNYQYCSKCFTKRKSLLSYPKKCKQKSKSETKITTLSANMSSSATTSGYQSNTMTTGSLQSSMSLNSPSYSGNPLTNDMCIMCLSSPKNCAFIHTRAVHISTCYSCAIKTWSTTKRCPICNNKASNILKAFIY